MKSTPANKKVTVRRLAFIAITAAIPLLALLFLWYQDGRNTAQAAHDAYLAGDCRTALPLYEDASSYPAIFGRFGVASAVESTECEALLTAVQTELSGPEAAIVAYEQFIVEHPDSALTTPALAAIHRLYLDSAATESEGGNFAEAIAILEKGAADYPALEAEIEERLLQTYLAWAERLQVAGDDEGALAVLNELQNRYPQFTAEAQAEIDKLNNAVGQ